MSESLIKLDGVEKVFMTDEVETHALAGIHMDIKKGEYVSISGPSGCGKSTLLAILGLLRVVKPEPLDDAVELTTRRGPCLGVRILSPLASAPAGLGWARATPPYTWHLQGRR